VTRKRVYKCRVKLNVPDAMKRDRRTRIPRPDHPITPEEVERVTGSLRKHRVFSIRRRRIRHTSTATERCAGCTYGLKYDYTSR